MLQTGTTRASPHALVLKYGNQVGGVPFHLLQAAQEINASCLKATQHSAGALGTSETIGSEGVEREHLYAVPDA